MILRQILAFVAGVLVTFCTGASFADARTNRSPSMIISAPTNGQVVPFLNPAYVHGTAFDSDGVVTQVLYFVNGQLVGAGAGQNWLLAWFATNLGPQVLMARAIDNKGASADSAPIRVEVKTFSPQLILLDPERIPETIEPLEGAILPLGSTNRFLANLDVYFPVHTIDLLVDGVKQNDARTFTYLIWIPTNSGLHRLQAVIADSSVTRLTSSPVMITIANVQPPSLTILSPAPKSSFARGSTITIRASARDSKGQITNMAIGGVGQTYWGNRAPTIERAISNLESGWHRVEVTAVNDSAQRTHQFVEFFVAYEENLALPTPEGFAGEADAPNSVMLTWKVPTPKGAAVWLTAEQRQGNGKWIDIGGASIEDGELVASELQAETSYAFRIAFLDNDQRRSAYSPIVSLVTPPWTTVPARLPVKGRR